jgi:hypothetical protein
MKRCTEFAVTVVFAAVACLPCAALAQVGLTFSIDFQGPTIGVPEGFGSGLAIDEGSILTPQPPGPPGPNMPVPGPIALPPGIVVPSGAGGLGITPTAAVPPAYVELDALSYGLDKGPELYFSVDEFAIGDPGAAWPAPSVTSEGAAAGASNEASADVFRYLGNVPAAPVNIVVPIASGTGPGNIDVIDGDGVPPFGGPGSGLVEPNPPTPGQWPDPGDNLDAVDIDSNVDVLGAAIYFSLDCSYPDPIEVPVGGAPPPNTGTALANGFVGGDVLVVPAPGQPMVLYATANQLGLDLTFTGAFNVDDLDALALWDNGDMQYTPGVDIILFSVRRGSAVVGAADSFSGVPISEGAVIVPPVIGGVSPFPAILVPAEALGLATTRSQTGLQNDELDALDVIPEPTAGLALLLGALAFVGRRRP